jgi:hypothetical protein
MNEELERWKNDSERGLLFVTNLIKEGKYDEYIKSLNRGKYA